MIKIEKTKVWGFEHAIRGMRNPMNSWNKSDSKYCTKLADASCNKNKCQFYQFSNNQHVCTLKTTKLMDRYILGPNDLALAMKLAKAGPAHRKYLRQIFVSFDLTAPLYW